MVLLACEVVRSDWNLLTILRKILPSSSGTRQYVFLSPENSVIFNQLLYHVWTQENNLGIHNINKNRFRIWKKFFMLRATGQSTETQMQQVFILLLLPALWKVALSIRQYEQYYVSSYVKLIFFLWLQPWRLHTEIPSLACLWVLSLRNDLAGWLNGTDLKFPFTRVSLRISNQKRFSMVFLSLTLTLLLILILSISQSAWGSVVVKALRY